MDFEKEVTEIAGMIKPEYEYVLADETIAITTEALEEIEFDYGLDSDNPLSFHNAPHSVGVTRRGVRMANILYPYLDQIQRRRFFDLAIIDGATHDRIQDLGPVENEKASAEFAVSKIEEADGRLNTKIFKKRLTYGNMATAVRMEEDGRLVQINLRRGAHDPIKFNMAFSDINGIAMEGKERMWADGTNLYYELCARNGEEPTNKGLGDFLVGQATFLRQRLNDHQVKADIAYYFPDDAGEVYKDMRKAFRGNILSAFSLAVMLGERPELQSSIGHIVSAVDRPVLGPIIGKMIRHKANR